MWQKELQNKNNGLHFCSTKQLSQELFKSYLRENLNNLSFKFFFSFKVHNVRSIKNLQYFYLLSHELLVLRED